MTSMTNSERPVTGGVDTHGETHHAAVIDSIGRQLGDKEFPATPAGYRALLRWMQTFGTVDRVGVEGTGSYGLGLTHVLRREQVRVVEVDRPNRRARRLKGKSDPLDAYAAARAALNGDATGTPKTRDGHVEMIRMLKIQRKSAIKARTQTMNQLKALIVTHRHRSRRPA
jgi:transposase